MKATENITAVDVDVDIIQVDADVDAATVDADADTEAAVVTDGVT